MGIRVIGSKFIQRAYCLVAPRCLIARFDGAMLSPEWKEATWDRFVTGAPRSRCPVGECMHSPRGAHAVRAAIQRSQASLAQLRRELGINPKTVPKWRKRATVEDMKTGPSEPRSGIQLGQLIKGRSHGGKINRCHGTSPVPANFETDSDPVPAPYTNHTAYARHLSQAPNRLT